MKTQISRDGYRRDKRYSGVYQQQGRMITDSDWNELVDTLKVRVDEALVDVIGAGSPKGRAAAIQMSGTVPKIVPGTVYAGGIEGQIVAASGGSAPFDFTQQADFPSPPPLPAAGTAYRIYADVWDRPVGPLEDDGLRDPALHGADTCTRTQTMVQVKWSPAGKNPENPADNPAQGDARLTLKYPQGSGTQTASPDACDPKTQEVDPIGGDFLFRVEIHDVRWPGGAAPGAPDRVVVKWSRENGAEQYAFADMPDWFTTGPWIYELYDADSERHLGFHLATTTWTPKRGSLTKTLPSTAPAGTMVRRWEGYSVLVRSVNTWSVSTGSGETTADTAGGATVQIAGGAVTVSLTDLELSLELLNKTFLSGDFWSAPVRRSTYQAGRELLSNALPAGIVHRYVMLAEVQSNNQLKARTAQEQRKLAFPRLTELDAADMGYSTTCTSGLFTSAHDTVEKALNRLCAIQGSHVGYTKPSNDSVYRGENPTTVKEALDLLAAVKADDIGYTTTRDSTVDSVQEALDALFTRRAGSGSRATVGTGGDFGTIGDALNALHAGGDIALELLPGSHTWPAAFDVGLLAGDRLSISGVGPATQIFSNGNLRLDQLRRFELDRVSLVLYQGQLALDRCEEVLFTDCRIEGSNIFSKESLMHLSTGNSPNRTVIRNCVFDTQPVSRPQWVEFVLSPIAGGISDIYDSNLTNFETQIAGIARGLGTLTAQERLNLAQVIRERLHDGPGEGPPPPNGGVAAVLPPSDGDWASTNLHVYEYTAYLTIVIHLEAQSFDVDNMTMAFHLLRQSLVRIDPAAVLLFKLGNQGLVLLESNDFRGLISLYGAPEWSEFDVSAVWSKHRNGRIMFNGNSELQMRNNRMLGIRVSQSVYDFLRQVIDAPSTGPALLFPDNAFRSITLTDNQITEPLGALFARHVQLNSTDFTHSESAGWVISETGIYIGNRGYQPAILADVSRFASAVGNLIFDIVRLP